MRKKVLASLLAVGVLFSCIAVQAEEGCSHSNTTTHSWDYVSGVDTHYYIAPDGTTKSCDIKSGMRYHQTVCTICGKEISFSSKPFNNEHSTNHN